MSYWTAKRQARQADQAAQAQQQGIQQSQQYSAEAAKEASELLSPLSSLMAPTLSNLNTAAQEYQRLGTIGNQGLIAQQAPLDISKFYNPNEKAQLAAGRQAVESSAAARGGLMSGAALQSLQRMGQGIAAQNFNDAAQLALNNRQQQTGIAQTLSGMGDTATNINQNLFSTGVNATGQQANIVGMQGTNNANLAMTSGNVAAQAATSKPSPWGSLFNTALGLGTAWMMRPTSDRNKKYAEENITDEEVDEFLASLEPKSFKYKNEVKKVGAPEGRQSGIMAQDAEKSKMGKRIVEDTPDGKRLNLPMTVSTLLATSASLNKRLSKLEKGKK